MTQVVDTYKGIQIEEENRGGMASISEPNRSRCSFASVRSARAYIRRQIREENPYFVKAANIAEEEADSPKIKPDGEDDFREVCWLPNQLEDLLSEQADYLKPSEIKRLIGILKDAAK